ncbi:GNAT family N-acetyltransferase [Phytoactinopolyspora endophytica]|uniref:GNAT family N-acetyltransferase n=1 Tax=Phytoactinopolyspora endophytica TaxID=1642495 RepID=UPI00101DCCFF|nr:GNAT family N-acetyltransferase [Phytoactinopolyspora endophytica]
MAVDASELLSDVELLQIEMETLWDMNSDGRIPGSHYLVIGATGSARRVAVGAGVPDMLADELTDLVLSETEPCASGRPPASLARCQGLLEDAFGAVERSSGPSYLIPSGVGFAATADMVLSGSAQVEAVRDAHPGDWDVDEWDQLLAGNLGPWAMATHQGQVIAMCNTPAQTARGAEAGVWTHPDFRGQGHAAAVTAQWATLMAPSGRRLLYSTSATNQSSQRVAARLGLRPIGWLWKLSRPGEQGVHSGRR